MFAKRSCARTGARRSLLVLLLAAVTVSATGCAPGGAPSGPLPGLPLGPDPAGFSAAPPVFGRPPSNLNGGGAGNLQEPVPPLGALDTDRYAGWNGLDEATRGAELGRRLPNPSPAFGGPR